MILEGEKKKKKSYLEFIYSGSFKKDYNGSVHLYSDFHYLACRRNPREIYIYTETYCEFIRYLYIC